MDIYLCRYVCVCVRIYAYTYIFIYITWGGDSNRASAAAWSTAVTRNAPVWFYLSLLAHI